MKIRREFLYKSIEKSILKIQLIKKIILLGIIVCSFSDAYSETSNIDSQPILIINQSSIENPINEYMEFLIDSSGTATLDDVKRIDSWEKVPNSKPNFGLTQDVYWLRFKTDFSQVNANNYYLVFDYPILDSVEIYSFQGEKMNYFHTGDSLQFKHRSLEHRLLNYRMDLDNLPDTIYLRIQSTGSLQAGGYIIEESKYKNSVAKENLTLSTYYGAMIVILIYVLAIYFFLKENIYFVYTLYIGFYLLFQSNLNGILFSVFLRNFPSIYNAMIPVSFFMAFGSALMFNAIFLETNNRPRLDKFIKYSSIILFLFSIPSAFIPYYIVVKIITFVGFFGPIVFIYSAIVRRKDGYKPANYYLLAWGFFIIGMVIYALKTGGILPSNHFTEYAMQYGSLAEALFFSIGLSYRFHLIRKANEALNDKLEAYSQELEEKVKVRTKELEQALENLNTTKKSLVENEKKSALTDLALGFSKELQKPILSIAMGIPYFKKEESSIRSLVEEMTSEEASEESGEFRDFIHSRLERYATIYKDIEYGLNRSRTILQELNEMSGMEINPEASVRLRKLAFLELLQARKSHTNTIGNKKVKIKLSSTCDPNIQTIPLTLIRIIRVLFENAFYFSSLAPEPIVRISLLENANGNYEIQIENNGAMIPLENETKIFDMFFSTKPIGTGKGTGLTLAKSLAEKIGAKIILKDRGEDSGFVEFVLEIPITMESEIP